MQWSRFMNENLAARDFLVGSERRSVSYGLCNRGACFAYWNVLNSINNLLLPLTFSESEVKTVSKIYCLYVNRTHRSVAISRVIFHGSLFGRVRYQDRKCRVIWQVNDLYAFILVSHLSKKKCYLARGCCSETWKCRIRKIVERSPIKD